MERRLKYEKDKYLKCVDIETANFAQLSFPAAIHSLMTDKATDVEGGTVCVGEFTLRVYKGLAA